MERPVGKYERPQKIKVTISKISAEISKLSKAAGNATS
jgi:hypothetical protein